MSTSVCLSGCVYVRGHVSATARPIFIKFLMLVTCNRGSIVKH